VDIGLCPTCARPYTSGEVSGIGLLHARPEDRGGPWVDFECPGCGRRIRLVPHGHGRFAPPGVAPPPPVPPEHRAPPWAGTARPPPPPPADAVGAPPPPASGPPPASESPPDAKPPPASSSRSPLPHPPDGALTIYEALDLLGVSPTAERGEIERAYRERSLLCHPDKVAHLDAEFQALAEKKFRRLREAYEMLTSAG
jgi:hypothetical protein